jgi:hypothetical protein
MLYNFVTCIGDIAFFMLDPLHLPTATFNPAMLSPKPFCVMQWSHSSPIAFVNQRLLALELVPLLFLQSPRPDVLVQPCLK